MIIFKELNKKNEISDIELGSISLLNAKSLYDVFKTDKNILHLFYNGGYDFTSIDVIFELMEYDMSKYYSYKDFINTLKNKERSINIIYDKKQMKLLHKIDKKIPINPKYCYKELLDKN